MDVRDFLLLLSAGLGGFPRESQDRNPPKEMRSQRTMAFPEQVLRGRARRARSFRAPSVRRTSNPQEPVRPTLTTRIHVDRYSAGPPQLRRETRRRAISEIGRNCC